MEKFLSSLNPFKKEEPKFSGTGHRLGTAEEEAARRAHAQEARAAQARAAATAGPSLSATQAATSKLTASTPAAQAALGRSAPGAAAPSGRAAPPPAARPGPQAFVGTAHRLSDPPASQRQPAAAPPPRAPSVALTGPYAEIATAADGGKATAEVLYKLLDNLVREPGNDKFRRIRLTNPKIQAAVADAPGGLAVLLIAGYHVAMEKLPDGTEDTFAVVPPAADAAELQAQAEKARAALEGLLPLLPPGLVPLSAEPVDLNWPLDAPPNAGRRERVFFPSQQTLEAIPDEFFALSTEELVAEARKARTRLEAQSTLTTKAYKERMQQERQAQQGAQREATVRVRLPDGLLVQACFGVNEPVSSVYEWVASTLQEPHRTFALNLPGVGDLTAALEKKLAQQRRAGAGGRAAAQVASAMTLADADLVRGGLLNLGWGQGEPPPAPGPSLRQELASAAVALQ